MISKLLGAFGAFCVATVLTQFILFGYFLTRGSINGDTTTKIVALLNGIDITGNRLQQIMRAGEDREQPDFDDILEARKMESFDMDIRLRSQKGYRDELATMLAEIKAEGSRLDERLTDFRADMDEISTSAKKKGIQDVQRTLQSLDPAQAKEQLLIMYDDERIDDVVTIVKAMSSEKRSSILGEFVSDKEAEKLAEILRRIGEGMPTTTLIEETRAGL
jgi:flagellar motility protein MotE (MotC chaperone)